MVPTREQSPCSAGKWKQADANAEQVVPMCHRWQIRVKLPKTAAGPVEVGGLILGNDGTLLGFPFTAGEPVVLRPGKQHVFTLTRPGRQPGLRSIPPLGIPEHILVYGMPVGSNIDFASLSTWAKSRDAGTEGVEGVWTRVHVPFRVEANPQGRPDHVPEQAQRPGAGAHAGWVRRHTLSAGQSQLAALSVAAECRLFGRVRPQSRHWGGRWPGLRAVLACGFERDQQSEPL